MGLAFTIATLGGGLAPLATAQDRGEVILLAPGSLEPIAVNGSDRADTVILSVLNPGSAEARLSITYLEKGRPSVPVLIAGSPAPPAAGSPAAGSPAAGSVTLSASAVAPLPAGRVADVELNIVASDRIASSVTGQLILALEGAGAPRPLVKPISMTFSEQDPPSVVAGTAAAAPASVTIVCTDNPLSHKRCLTGDAALTFPRDEQATPAESPPEIGALEAWLSSGTGHTLRAFLGPPVADQSVWRSTLGLDRPPHPGEYKGSLPTGTGPEAKTVEVIAKVRWPAFFFWLPLFFGVLAAALGGPVLDRRLVGRREQGRLLKALNTYVSSRRAEEWTPRWQRLQVGGLGGMPALDDQFGAMREPLTADPAVTDLPPRTGARRLYAALGASLKRSAHWWSEQVAGVEAIEASGRRWALLAPAMRAAQVSYRRVLGRGENERLSGPGPAGREHLPIRDLWRLLSEDAAALPKDDPANERLGERLRLQAAVVDAWAQARAAYREAFGASPPTTEQELDPDGLYAAAGSEPSRDVEESRQLVSALEVLELKLRRRPRPREREVKGLAPAEGFGRSAVHAAAQAAVELSYWSQLRSAFPYRVSAASRVQRGQARERRDDARLAVASWVSFLLLTLAVVIVFAADQYGDTWGGWLDVLLAFAAGLGGGALSIVWDRLPFMHAPAMAAKD